MTRPDPVAHCTHVQPKGSLNFPAEQLAEEGAVPRAFQHGEPQFCIAALPALEALLGDDGWIPPVQAVQDERLSLISGRISSQTLALANRAGTDRVRVLLKPTIDTVQVVAMSTDELHLLVGLGIPSAFHTKRTQGQVIFALHQGILDMLDLLPASVVRGPVLPTQSSVQKEADNQDEQGEAQKPGHAKKHGHDHRAPLLAKVDFGTWRLLRSID
mmetsp:Transcript_47920/g.89735  ORF Transcript_47920/g.89735 Transcript_47920/m.89735 type:complete len:215 (-) Transcript_47920:180-824(-)